MSNSVLVVILAIPVGIYFLNLFGYYMFDIAKDEEERTRNKGSLLSLIALIIAILLLKAQEDVFVWFGYGLAVITYDLLVLSWLNYPGSLKYVFTSNSVSEIEQENEDHTFQTAAKKARELVNEQDLEEQFNYLKNEKIIDCDYEVFQMFANSMKLRKDQKKISFLDTGHRKGNHPGSKSCLVALIDIHYEIVAYSNRNDVSQRMAHDELEKIINEYFDLKKHGSIKFDDNFISQSIVTIRSFRKSYLNREKRN